MNPVKPAKWVGNMPKSCQQFADPARGYRGGRIGSTPGMFGGSTRFPAGPICSKITAISTPRPVAVADIKIGFQPVAGNSVNSRSIMAWSPTKSLYWAGMGIFLRAADSITAPARPDLRFHHFFQLVKHV